MTILKVMCISCLIIIFYGTSFAANKAAGVLPYSYDNKGNTYFYISRESRGAAKDTWADFGGGFEPKDTSFEEVAARECAEESMEIMIDTNKKQLTEAHILNLIKSKVAVEQLIKVFPSGFSYGEFFLPIENSKGTLKRFHDKRKVLMKIYKDSLAKGIKVSKLLIAQTEKDVLASVDSKELVKSIVAGTTPQVTILTSSNPKLVPHKSTVPLRVPFYLTLKQAYANGIVKKIVDAHKKPIIDGTAQFLVQLQQMQSTLFNLSKK